MLAGDYESIPCDRIAAQEGSVCEAVLAGEYESTSRDEIAECEDRCYEAVHSVQVKATLRLFRAAFCWERRQSVVLMSAAV